MTLKNKNSINSLKYQYKLDLDICLTKWKKTIYNDIDPAYIAHL